MAGASAILKNYGDCKFIVKAWARKNRSCTHKTGYFFIFYYFFISFCPSLPSIVDAFDELIDGDFGVIDIFALADVGEFPAYSFEG